MEEISAAGFDYFATVGFASENATATARVEHSVCDIEVVLDSSFPLLPYRQTQQGVVGVVDGKKVGKTATVWSQL